MSRVKRALIGVGIAAAFAVPLTFVGLASGAGKVQMAVFYYNPSPYGVASEKAAILDEMAQAERDGAVHEYGVLNRRFHMAAYAAQPWVKLRQMIESMGDSTDWCRWIFTTEADSMRFSLAEHVAIYEALARGDGDTAGVFLRAQKHRAVSWLLDHIGEAEGASTST